MAASASLEPKTSGERLLAVASHGSIAVLLLSFLPQIGVVAAYVALLLPLLVWSFSFTRSRWLAYNALEALLYQIIVFMGSLFLTLAIYRAVGSSTIWLLSVILLVLRIPFVALGLAAAVRAWRGGLFHYPLLAPVLRRLAGASPRRS